MYEGVIESLFKEYTKHGFISENHIFEALENNNISLFDVEYICDQLLSKGVIIKDDEPKEDEDEEYDRSHIDYEDIFREVLEIDDSFVEFIEYIRAIQAPQYREWQNLMPQAKRNNLYARNRIFEMYIRVAVRIALAYSKRYQLPLDETIQSALIGLYFSIEKYEPARQDNFVTYFPLWVRNYIMRSAQTINPLIYFPVHVKDKLFAIYDNMQYYCGDIVIGDEPGEDLINSIVVELECSYEEARRMIEYLKPFESLEYIMEATSSEYSFSDEGYANEEMLSNLDILTDVKNLHSKIDKLTQKEKKVIMLRYGIGEDDGMSLREVGEHLGVTRERVRQIEAKALQKLRKFYHSDTKKQNKSDPLK